MKSYEEHLKYAVDFCIRRAGTGNSASTRALCDCIENTDGERLMSELVRRAHKNPKLEAGVRLMFSVSSINSAAVKFGVEPLAVSDADSDGWKRFILDLGYEVRQDSQQPGLWLWGSDIDACGSSFHSESDAFAGAWDNAVARTLESAHAPSCDWESSSSDQKRVAMSLALSGEVPPFSVLGLDTQQAWVAKVRETYPEIGPKEALRLAEEAYLQKDGDDSPRISRHEVQRG